MPKKISIVLITVIFVAILVFANSKGLLDGAKRTTNVLVAPIGTVFSSTGEGIAVFFSSLFNLGKLQEESANLENEVNKLRSEIARLGELERENDSLRKELGFARKGDYVYQSADVISYDPSNIRGMVTINRGSESGIRVGMAVTSEGYLLGRVSEIGKNFSKVQLVIDPTSAIPVAIQGTDINGIAKGELGSGLSVEKIPQGAKFSAGNTVITSGLGGEIPRGIIIGEIESTDSQENSLFISAKVRVRSNINNVLRVLVIKK
jgi:rod shape-determining protein MreC